jgi:N-methylhydantoinase A
VNAVGQKLLSSGVESVVVHFLHSYVNPEHELRAAALLDKFWPNPYITVGHKLLLESREFERGVTAAVNASVQPLLERYLKRLSEELQGRGYLGELLIMNGNGGTISANRVVEEAVKTVMSGPASGVIAAAYTGRCAKRPNLITYDMGGTSTDVALIYDCQPSVSNEIEIEYAMPIHVPMVDVRTIGAGGGSIARVNQAGLLEVGPESAGADPGPICYGLGGDLPTITDANALLGRLDIEKFGRGKEKVSVDRIREIFQLKIGNPLGVDAETAASAVLRMANTLMAGAIRMVSISLGADPRDFSLFAFGGAGPLHASALASELGIPEVFVPARPGITNALGCVVADLRYDFVRTINTPLDIIETTVLEEMLLKQSFDGNALVEQEPVDIDKIKIEHSLDMQFVGQTHMLTVPMECANMTRKDILSAFEKIYFDRFRIHLPEVRVRIVNVRTIVTGCRPTIDLTGLIDCAGRAHSLSAAKTGSRKVCFYGPKNVLNWHDVPIYNREKLPLEFQLNGPAILEQMDTTVVIEPQNNVSSDRYGNIFIKVGVIDET